MTVRACTVRGGCSRDRYILNVYTGWVLGKYFLRFCIQHCVISWTKLEDPSILWSKVNIDAPVDFFWRISRSCHAVLMILVSSEDYNHFQKAVDCWSCQASQAMLRIIWFDLWKLLCLWMWPRSCVVEVQKVEVKMKVAPAGFWSWSKKYATWNSQVSVRLFLSEEFSRSKNDFKAVWVRKSNFLGEEIQNPRWFLFRKISKQGKYHGSDDWI